MFSVTNSQVSPYSGLVPNRSQQPAFSAIGQPKNSFQSTHSLLQRSQDELRFAGAIACGREENAAETADAIPGRKEPRYYGLGLYNVLRGAEAMIGEVIHDDGQGGYSPEGQEPTELNVRFYTNLFLQEFLGTPVILPHVSKKNIEFLKEHFEDALDRPIHPAAIEKLHRHTVNLMEMIDESQPITLGVVLGALEKKVEKHLPKADTKEGYSPFDFSWLKKGAPSGAAAKTKASKCST